MKKPLLIFVLSMHVFAAGAQRGTKPFEIGLQGGILVYQGDLTPRRLGSWETLKPGVKLHAARVLNDNWLLRASLLRGSLKGDDAKYSKPDYRRFRNFRFRTPVTELSVQAIWFPSGSRPVKKRFSPFLSGGAGLGLLRVQRDWSRFNYLHFVLEPDLPGRISQDAAHKTPRLIPVVPLGAGLRYGLSDKWSLDLEWNYRLSFSDYLDGFSIAANPDRKDHYHSTMIGITRRFGEKDATACPVMRY